MMPRVFCRTWNELLDKYEAHSWSGLFFFFFKLDVGHLGKKKPKGE